MKLIAMILLGLIYSVAHGEQRWAPLVNGLDSNSMLQHAHSWQQQGVEVDYVWTTEGGGGGPRKEGEDAFTTLSRASRYILDFRAEQLRRREEQIKAGRAPNVAVPTGDLKWDLLQLSGDKEALDTVMSDSIFQPTAGGTADPGIYPGLINAVTEAQRK